MESRFNRNTEKELIAIVTRVVNEVTAIQTLRLLLKAMFLVIEKMTQYNPLDSYISETKTIVQGLDTKFSNTQPCAMEPESPLAKAVRLLRDCPELVLEQPILDDIYTKLRNPATSIFVFRSASAITQKLTIFPRSGRSETQVGIMIDEIHDLHEKLLREIKHNTT